MLDARRVARERRLHVTSYHMIAVFGGAGLHNDARCSAIVVTKRFAGSVSFTIGLIGHAGDRSSTDRYALWGIARVADYLGADMRGFCFCKKRVKNDRRTPRPVSQQMHEKQRA